jgi:hypothetical protein
MSIAETLQTPHPLKAPDALQQPLTSVVDTAAMSEFLGIAHGLGEEMYADALTDGIDHISRETRNALWYPKEPVTVHGKRIALSPYPSLEHLEEEQVADCYGFTIVASELLGRAGIAHFIGYMNGHAAILAPLGGGRVRYADPLSPELNHEATNSIDTAALLRSMASGEGNKFALHFNTSSMASALQQPWHSLVSKYPWMTTKAAKLGKTPTEARNSKPIITVFQPQTARFILETHATFLRAVSEGDDLAAVSALEQIGNLYPDVDLRGRHNAIRALTRSLASDGHIDLARASIDTYLSSISTVGDDPRINVLRGDCLRTVAISGAHEASATDAVAAYEHAQATATHGLGIIAGKVRKARRLAGTVCDMAISSTSDSARMREVEEYISS